VSGLSGTVVLQNNLGGNLSVTAIGAFQFANTATSGAAYSVTVLTQPAGQNCVVGSGTGTVTANVSTVTVTCTANTVKVGGAISGLNGVLQLRNSAGTPVQFNADGTYSFNVAPGTLYNINVVTLPALQNCDIANPTGNANADVTNVNVTCADVTLVAYAGVANFDTIFVSWGAANWNALRANWFRILEDADGASGFTDLARVGDVPSGTSGYDLKSPVYARLTARYKVRACAFGRCIESAPVPLVPATNTQFNDVITYMKAFNTNEHDNFGFGIAISGDGSTIAVGALTESSNATGVNGDQFDNSAFGSGAVYVYARQGRGWQAQAYIKASNTQTGDAFGSWLALSYDGSTLAVGAPGEDSAATGINGDQASNARPGSGATYVFTRAGSSWSQQAYLKAPNPGVNANFGRVAMSGDGNLLAVSAIGEDSGSGGIDGNSASTSATDSGAVFLFARSGSTWAQQTYIKAATPMQSSHFGTALAFSHLGDTLAVGAPEEFIGGACYVFVKSGATWLQQARVTPSVSDPEDHFGFSVDVSDPGDTLAVGAIGEKSIAVGIGGDPTDNTVSQAGAAYLFERSGTAWSQQVYLKPSVVNSGGEFGTAVRLSGPGDLLAITAPGDGSDNIGMTLSPNNASNAATGAVYVYARNGSGWGTRSFLKSMHPRTFDHLGGSGLAMSGDGSVLAVGSTADPSNATGTNGDQNNDSAPNAGAVHIF
jgi:hypothetical protein